MLTAQPVVPLYTDNGAFCLSTICDAAALYIRVYDGVEYGLIPVDFIGAECLPNGSGNSGVVYGDILAVIDTSISGVNIVDGCGCGDVLSWCAGDGYPLQVTLTDSDGTAIDITGWGIQMTIGALVTDSATITDGVNGVFTVDIPKDTLTDGYYDYSFKHVTAGTTRTISGGSIKVS